jgi:hypothetical protein
MGDEELIRRLLEDALNAGRTPEEVCRLHPDLLDEVRRRWMRIRTLAGELDRFFPPAEDGDADRRS